MTTQITGFTNSRPWQTNTPLVDQSLPRQAIVSQPAQVVESAASSALLQNAVAEANQLLSQTRADLKLDIDSESNEVVIKIIEPDSGEILNQYPTKASLAIANAIAELQQKALDRRAAYQSDSAMSGLIIKQKS